MSEKQCACMHQLDHLQWPNTFNECVIMLINELTPFPPGTHAHTLLLPFTHTYTQHHRYSTMPNNNNDGDNNTTPGQASALAWTHPTSQ